MDLLWNAYVTWQEHKVKCTVEITTQNTAQSLASLAKWLSVRLRTKWFWVWIQLQSILLKVCFRKIFAISQNFRKILETLWKSLFFLWELHAGSQPRRPTCDWCNVLPCVLSYMSFIKLFSTFKFFCCFFINLRMHLLFYRPRWVITWGELPQSTKLVPFVKTRQYG